MSWCKQGDQRQERDTETQPISQQTSQKNGQADRQTDRARISDLLLLDVSGFLEALADVVVVGTRFASKAHGTTKGLNHK
jgi:hypothetical protein